MTRTAEWLDDFIADAGRALDEQPELTYAEYMRSRLQAGDVDEPEPPGVRTPPAYRAATYLETAALGYAEQVRSWAGTIASMHRTTPPNIHPNALESFVGAREFLSTTALSYAGAMGALDAAQQAELRELRRFRDGVVGLRAELAAGDFAAETINALFTMYPLAALSPQIPEEQS